MIKIDPEFKALIPPLSSGEREQLEANILQDGCRDPLVVWDGTLIDGHNRFEICAKHDLPYDTKNYDFDDRDAAKDWIIKNQLGRRNLTPDKMAALRGLRYNLEKKKAAPPIGNQNARKQGGQNVHLDSEPFSSCKTAARHAADAGVTERTIRRDGKKMEALEDSPELVADVMTGKKKLAEAVAIAEARKPKPEPAPTKPIMTKKEAAAMPTCRGMKLARLAIMDLEQIPETDSERNQAFQHVREWINDHE